MPSKIPGTIQKISATGRMKTMYPISCANCRKSAFNYRKDNGKRFCTQSCATLFEFRNGRDRFQAVKKAQSVARELEYKFLHKTSGKTHWNWQGGISSDREKLRVKFRPIRKAVLLRDDNTCQVCHIQNQNMHVDHIRSWSNYPELRFDVNNCRTLCVPCHFYVTFKKKMPATSTWGISKTIKEIA